jgi:hypothetical protein
MSTMLHRIKHLILILAGTLAVATPFALAVPQASAKPLAVPNAATLISVNKKLAVCEYPDGSGDYAGEGTEVTVYVTTIDSSGRLTVDQINLVCGADGHWH